MPNIYFSLAESTQVEIENREQMLADIESGKLDYIEFNARVFFEKPNKNHVRVRQADMSAFAPSFKNKPFIRDHNIYSIEARDGTITDSRLNVDAIEQTIKLTTRKGMTAYVEGQIDRFSIGFEAEKTLCSICDTDYRTCAHMRGNKYENKTCEVVMVNPVGVETSAVNNPAVDNTAILSTLEENKPTQKEIFKMAENTITKKIEENQQAAAELLGAHDQIAAQQEQLQASENILLAQCEILLNSGLSTSRLPEIVQTRIRNQYKGKRFTATELQSAIDDARAEVSALTQGALVRGPGRIEVGANSKDQYTAAVYDLLGVKRPDDLAKVRTARLSGIREMYLTATGDYDFMGRVDNEHFELATSADLPAVLVDAMNVSIGSAWAQYAEAGYEWWKPIVDVRHSTNMQTPKGVLIGQVNVLPTVAEGGAYTELDLEDAKETGAWTKSGGYIGLTLEMLLKDETDKLKAYPKVLAFSAIRKISSLVAAVFTGNSGAGPTMTDTKAVFHADHGNLGTAALTGAAWETAAAAVYSQSLLVESGDTGGVQAVDPRYLLVPRVLRLTAQRILYPSWEREANMTSENLQRGQQGDVIVVPEFTDATDWAQVVDPRIIPGIVVSEVFGLMPQVYTMSGETAYTMFMNDEMRIKARNIVSVFVENHRALRKHNVA